MPNLASALAVILLLGGFGQGAKGDYPPPRSVDYSLPAASQDSPSAFRDAALDSAIEAEMATGHVAGLAAARITANGPFWFNGYGLANVDEDRPVQAETLFMLASISKTITGTALMQLWEDGLFGLDDDVNEYLPFTVENPWNPKIAITFRMLMTHTSSINDNWDLMPYYQGDSPIALGDYLEDYLSPAGTNYDPNNNFNNWAPGTTWDYSNIGIALGGYLVELLSGQPFDEYCRQEIFLPLRMNETAWHLADLEPSHIAMPYHWDGAEYQPFGLYGYSDYPSGQLRTSVNQLGRFLAAYINRGIYQGQRILDESTVNMMLTVQYPAISTIQGLVWRKMGDSWSHGGGDYGVNTTMYFNPVEETGAIVFTNGSNGEVTGTVGGWVYGYELLEPSMLDLAIDHDELSWMPPGDALNYDVVRGNLTTLRSNSGDFGLATESCEADDHPFTFMPYLFDPSPGQGWWFLARRVTAGGNGSYDTEEPFQADSRDDGILYSGNDCP